MYADRVIGGSKRSVRERLNGNTEEDFGRRREINGKRSTSTFLAKGPNCTWHHTIDRKVPEADPSASRLQISDLLHGCRSSRDMWQRQDDNKWEHDLYEDDDPQDSNRRVGDMDLRLKLQKKISPQVYQTQSGKGSLAGGVQDLRGRLSGTMHSQPANSDLPKPKPKPVLEAAKPARKSVAVEVPLQETRKVAKSASSRKKTQQKADTSVNGFLQSLGLEKYMITFQAEEIDMTALIHMTDGDLKTLGIPMGPRKKILLELDSRA
ncbi:hypothetical protein HHK36_020269 [Tetracentron sinense]|uniref:SAM domain-containing protein n=1 Tax=Tetracentron sinense TaxID=13715 RepID=A0A835D8P1_TETSI|nr:hypothetical protein HHK36_020269 [Tetracentron sinense]